MRWKKVLWLYAIGSVGYGLIEVLWRGYTHWSMGVAGGICLNVMALIGEKLHRWKQVWKCALSAGCITAVEYVFGWIFNVKLGLGVWDYSAHWMNLQGQICPLFTGLWFLLSWPAMQLAGAFQNFLTNRQGRDIIHTTSTE